MFACYMIFFRMCICGLKVHPSDRECSKTVLVPSMNVLPDFNDMMLSYECSGIRFVRESRFGSIRSQCTSLIFELDIMDADTLSNGNSKFFGPSPRKQRLTVYRGLQVNHHSNSNTNNINNPSNDLLLKLAHYMPTANQKFNMC